MVSFIAFRFFPLTGIEGSRNAVRVNRSGEHVAGDLMIRGVGHQRWRHGVENRKRIKEKSSIQKVSINQSDILLHPAREPGKLVSSASRERISDARGWRAACIIPREMRVSNIVETKKSLAAKTSE